MRAHTVIAYFHPLQMRFGIEILDSRGQVLDDRPQTAGSRVPHRSSLDSNHRPLVVHMERVRPGTDNFRLDHRLDERTKIRIAYGEVARSVIDDSPIEWCAGIPQATRGHPSTDPTPAIHHLHLRTSLHSRLGGCHASYSGTDNQKIGTTAHISRLVPPFTHERSE